MDLVTLSVLLVLLLELIPMTSSMWFHHFSVGIGPCLWAPLLVSSAGADGSARGEERRRRVGD